MGRPNASAPKMIPSLERIALPAPAPGTKRELLVRRYGRPDARPLAYLHAGLHADELPGMLVLHHLSRLIEAGRDPLLGGVVIVPVANPVGLAQRVNGYLAGRFELAAGGGNFNRAFPDLSEAVAEEVRGRLGDDEGANIALIRRAALEAVSALPRNSELQALRATLLGLSLSADYVLDLHCDTEALPHVYVAEDHLETAAALGAEIGARAILVETAPGGAPFDEANAGLWWKLRERLGDGRIPLACFAATLEFRGQADVSDDVAAADAAALYRFLQRRGVVGGNPGPVPEPLCVPTPLEATDFLEAPVSGLVAYRKAPGDHVAAGEIVAEIVDPMAADPDKARTPVASRAEGVVLTRSLRRMLGAGETVAKVAGSLPLPHRKAGNLLEV